MSLTREQQTQKNEEIFEAGRDRNKTDDNIREMISNRAGTDSADPLYRLYAVQGAAIGGRNNLVLELINGTDDSTIKTKMINDALIGAARSAAHNGNDQLVQDLVKLGGDIKFAFRGAAMSMSSYKNSYLEKLWTSASNAEQKRVTPEIKRGFELHEKRDIFIQLDLSTLPDNDTIRKAAIAAQADAAKAQAAAEKAAAGKASRKLNITTALLIGGVLTFAVLAAAAIVTVAVLSGGAAVAPLAFAFGVTAPTWIPIAAGVIAGLAAAIGIGGVVARHVSLKQSEQDIKNAGRQNKDGFLSNVSPKGDPKVKESITNPFKKLAAMFKSSKTKKNEMKKDDNTVELDNLSSKPVKRIVSYKDQLKHTVKSTPFKKNP